MQERQLVPSVRVPAAALRLQNFLAMFRLQRVEVDPTGRTAIEFFEPSPDGSLIAISLAKDGSEDGVLHVLPMFSIRKFSVGKNELFMK